STAYFFSVVHRNECCLVSSLFPYTTLFRSIYFTFGGEVKPYDIIGVVEDFNFESLRDPVSPLGFFLEDNYTQAAFKIETANLSRSEEHTSELQSRENLVCRLLLEKKKNVNV